MQPSNGLPRLTYASATAGQNKCLVFALGGNDWYMPEMNDQALVQKYAGDNSESAFAESAYPSVHDGHKEPIFMKYPVLSLFELITFGIVTMPVVPVATWAITFFIHLYDK